MLSILIPTYNSNCLDLIYFINNQANEQGFVYEILLADDASNEEFRTLNKVIAELDNCYYLQLEKNLGPANVRNFLAEQAKYPYLLFLDSDVMPIDGLFLRRYVDGLQSNSVLCGGFKYKTDDIPKDSILRFKYGLNIEQQDVLSRSKKPYNSFISMNFLISKESFMKVRFDESFHLGYEDTLFGKRLKECSVKMFHIDNPVYHCVEETSEQFLLKIKRAVANLIGHEKEMKEYVKLLSWYDKVYKLGMQPLLSLLFNTFEPYLVSNLTSKNPSLKLFSFYKLGYLCSLKEHLNKKD